jgi:cobalt-zinc-cadmium efflux system outer membrane protein
MGRACGESTIELAGGLDVAMPATPLGVEEAWALAEENRPDILALRNQVAQARASIHAEQTKAYPQVTPSAGTQHQYQTELGIPDFSGYNVALSVSVPLFDRNQGNICKARSVLVQNSFTLQAQLVQLRADVQQAVSEFDAARVDVISIGPEQLEAAKSVRDRTEAAYKVGGKTLLEVIDAERAYRDTFRTYIMGQSGYWHSLDRLNAAVGRQVLR